MTDIIIYILIFLTLAGGGGFAFWKYKNKFPIKDMEEMRKGVEFFSKKIHNLPNGHNAKRGIREFERIANSIESELKKNRTPETFNHAIGRYRVLIDDMKKSISQPEKIV